jgi:hypothetical protein
MRTILHGCKYTFGLVTFVVMWITLTVDIVMNTGPAVWVVVPTSGVEVGPWMDTVVVLTPGTGVGGR